MKYALSIFLSLLLVPAIAQDQACSFQLVSSQTNASGNTRSDSITYSFNGANVAMLMHGRGGQPDVRMVFDPEAGTITQLHEIGGRKGGFVFPMSEKRWPGMSHSTAVPAKATMAPNGTSRTIGGHECHEVKVKSQDHTGTAWVATDIPLSMERVFAYQSVGGGKQTKEVDMLAAMGLTGLPMEMHLKNSTTGVDIVLEVLNYSDSMDAALFSTDGHSTTYVEE